MSNKAPETVPFTMPKVFRGQIVLWYQQGVRNESTACPALVKVEGQSSLHLKVFGIDGELDYTCVRHMDDPNAREYDRTENGLWDHANRKIEPAAIVETKNPLYGDRNKTADFEPSLEDATAL
jgi:hypothetical protein